MTINDRIKFRELQSIFFAGMAEYPNDKERMEKMLGILEKFIDDLVQRECNALFQKSTKIVPGHGSGRLIN